MATPSCKEAAESLNRHMSPAINAAELADMLSTLNQTQNRSLPPKFVTKQQAKEAGWRPGKSLWSAPALQGKSIGGDRFGNREGRLPRGKWREADLDYQGGKRGAKRLLYSPDGQRQVTVDHYETFTEVPACR
nr:ribonuclease domain-containing protein [Chitinivorax sp. B]